MNAEPIGRRSLLQFGLGAAAFAVASCSAERPTAGTVTRVEGPTSGTVPMPTGVVRTSWSIDPWSLGSYSYLPVGATPQARVDLATPIDVGWFFAGEALDSDNPSTVHGAQASGLAAAALVDDSVDGPTTVVVIGAGIAGASAARALVDAGHEVIVVEAQTVIGGRIHTVQPDGWPVPVELGASWVHDTAASDLATQLAELSVATVPIDYVGVVLGTDGRTIGEDRFAGSAAAVKGAVKWADDQEEDSTLRDALQRSGAAADVDALLLDHLLRTEITTEYGADAETLSATWGLAEGTDGDDLLVIGGYGTLVSAQLTGLDVRTNWPVASVIAGEGRSVVANTGGDSIEAERVIITVPLGVLKAGLIQFEPALPTTHLSAIDALGMGLLDKLWLRWDEPWWSEPAEQWTRVADQAEPFVEWFNLVAATGSPVLLALIGGEEARAWSAASDDDVVAAALGSLQHFLDAGW